LLAEALTTEIKERGGKKINKKIKTKKNLRLLAGVALKACQQLVKLVSS
jgi:hypothetical protein